jgi:hypothetical protein
MAWVHADMLEGRPRGRGTLACTVVVVMTVMVRSVLAVSDADPVTPLRVELSARPLLATTEPAGNVSAGRAEDSAPPAAETPPGRFPWLLVPVFSASPKLGTAGGALAAYIHKFDERSRVSMFGAAFIYTSTQSKVGAMFARTSFGEDHHRIDAIGVFGYVKNDYEDYLGTGQPLKTNDDAVAFAGRYRYRVKDNWFIGGQGAAVNYQVLGESSLDDAWLDTLGVQGFKSVGIGADVSHDSRDSQDMPTRGWFANLSNIAYRTWLGGDESFDVYRLDLRVFAGHGTQHVLAIRQKNDFTADAPVSGQSTVLLRGYKQGAYLAKNMSSLEVEERLRFSRRWGANGFAGVAALYGGSSGLTGNDALYTTFGGGLQFVVMPAQQLLMSFEYAYGNSTNSGLYLRLGYAW